MAGHSAILENSFLLDKILKLLRSSWVFDKSLKFVIEKLEKDASIYYNIII